MNALVAFEIVISVEALRALIATERSVCLRVGLRHVVTVKLLHGCVSAVVVHRHAMRHAVDKRKLTIWVADVREDRSKRRVGERGAGLLLVICRRL